VRFLTYASEQGPRLGVLVGELVYDVPALTVGPVWGNSALQVAGEGVAFGSGAAVMGVLAAFAWVTQRSARAVEQVRAWR